MNQPPRSTRLPGTVLAAVVLLSITTTADMSVAAVLVGAGRSNVDVSATSSESLHEWLTRLTHAARQIHGVFSGDEVQTSAPVATLPLRYVHAFDLACDHHTIIATHFAPPSAAPLRHALLNLPPPLA
ncbi:MAG: hypothetical protein WD768_01275 [Phycisphaeraceae bacterium]